MIRLVAIVTLLAGCRISLEDNATGDDDITGGQCKVDTTASCMEAVNHADLAWIESKVFAASCNFSGCHNGQDTPQGKVDLRTGKSHGSLVGFTSLIDTSRKLVVPNDVAASYLMLMLGDVPPAMANPPGAAPSPGIGYMPQGAPILCCQKLEAIERWIMAGAPNL